MSLSMGEVEGLWAEGKLIPLALAPIALWHLFENPQPTEELWIAGSEEALGEQF